MFLLRGVAAAGEHWAPQALRMDLWTGGVRYGVLGAVLLIAVLLVVLVVLRRHVRSRHLRSRIGFDLVPSAAFDPAPEAVRAHAHQLARTRPTWAWTPRAATGVRIRLFTGADGKLIYRMEGPRSVMGQLSQAGLGQVELRRVAESELGVGGGDLTSVPSSRSVNGGGDLTSASAESQAAVVR